MDDGVWATVEIALAPIPTIHKVLILAFIVQRLGSRHAVESWVNWDDRFSFIHSRSEPRERTKSWVADSFIHWLSAEPEGLKPFPKRSLKQMGLKEDGPMTPAQKEMVQRMYRTMVLGESGKRPN